ncbi:response regulator transcription factor [Sulfuricurvum sp.]|uniref:winged helix-turn-helix domain-containing protein n=1 Tax=Sulfuricurvum sp. TaxID=2025608 RepID=UPI00260A51CF|nr:response regulator transcription factor [Sulfuricurvum sp.]MDD2837319.1 response regulator transcription factor [Sulfuricurvum sp.]MDD3595792.1 response regulator transcription factor [Sulfuricurvum sp.]
MGSILVVEDDNGIQKMLNISLGAAGYELIKAGSVKSGLVALSQNPISLVLLDLGLPDGDGKTFIKEAKMFSDVPIIVVSARDIESEKIEALEMGADDYLTKPFSIGELIARIKALSRRVREKDESIHNEISIGKLTINLLNRTVMLDSNPLKLTKKEFELLALFAKNRGKVLTHTFVLENVWGRGYGNETHYLRVFMAQLRKKIEENPSMPQYIVTESGMGYRMNAPLS